MNVMVGCWVLAIGCAEAPRGTGVGSGTKVAAITSAASGEAAEAADASHDGPEDGSADALLGRIGLFAGEAETGPQKGVEGDPGRVGGSAGFTGEGRTRTKSCGCPPDPLTARRSFVSVRLRSPAGERRRLLASFGTREKGTMASIRDAKGDPNGVWEDVDWEDMSPEEQKLWGALGWKEDSWDEDEDPPAEDDLYWKDLKAPQQEAAQKLGYTQALWDEDDD